MIGLSVSDRKRVIMVALICAIVMNSVIPIRKAEAIVPALAAPEIALGAFVGVVAVAAIGMEVFGYSENADKTMAYAEGVWITGNKAMKDAVIASYNAAIEAGDKVMVLSDEVASYWAGVYNSMFAAKVAAEYNTIDGERVTALSSYDQLTIRLKAPVGYYYSVPSGYAREVVYAWRQGEQTIGATVSFIASGLPNTLLDIPDIRYGHIWPAPSAKTLAEQHIAMSTLFGWPGLLSKSTVENVLAQDVAIKKSMPRSIPLPSGQDFVYTPTSNPGIDVHMRDDGTLADDAGKVYAPDAVRVKVAPVPRVATDSAGAPIVDAAGVPVVGVPVGAVGVGSTAVPGTLVNVRTGEAIKAETGTANPPLDWASQPTTRINWAPLQMTGSALTRVFPFSIPWDVYAQLKIFDVKPQVPVIKVDVPEFWRAGNFVWHLKFNIDFALFDPVAIGIRWIGNIAFTVGLALAMRRFMPQ